MIKKILVSIIFLGLVFALLFSFRVIVSNQRSLSPLTFLSDSAWSELAEDPAVTYRGKIQYQLRCYKCHGFNGEGVDSFGKYHGVALNDSTWIYGSSYNAMLNTIYHGAGDMRGYGKKLIITDLHAITVYIKTLSESKPLNSE
ncbi:MAG: hypothetical protein CMP21_08450 [Rickettsiales bacterium]|nr:hypothetical protein [Rickettsiales bacterium]|tara:strand:- start:6393 stop:6821 length:429 start_codon:yes stop_codon:yes gene_type:complete